jgi:glycosyltransferase involved in cell wall biosynthesis
MPDNPGLTSFVKIFAPISKELVIVTGGYYVTLPDLGTSISIKNVKHLRGGNKTRDKVIDYVLFHLQSALFLLANLAGVDLVVFHVGTNLVLPMFVCKIARKKTLIVLSGLQSASTAHTFKKSRLKPFVVAANIVLEGINFHLATKIVAYSPSIIEQLGLQRYRNKTLATGARFIDTHLFTPRKSISDRGNIVGYVGRLSFEKAIFNFIDAMPQVTKACPDVRFTIIGDGPLYTEARSRICTADLVDKVELIRSAPHTDMPGYFNEMKLLVVPSWTETIPSVVPEAMACGTPVLSTLVGVVPDVIRDAENGFILENNSPACIAERTIEALKGLVTETISQKAVSTARDEFSYESAVMRYQKIIEAVYVGPK